MQHKPTMKDVARVAGVGTMTVSRLLNGSAPVSTEVAARVQRAIRKLDYRPNELARSLRGLRSRTIGVIVPYLYDPFFATCAHAISTVVKEHGYSAILTTSNEDPVTEYKEALLMLQRHVDGLVIIPADAPRSRLARPEFGRTHIVTLDRPARHPRLDSVVVQNRSGAQAAVEHLLAHGHRRVGFLGLSRGLYTIKARFDGYCRAMLEAGLSQQSSFECATLESTCGVVKQWFEGADPPTALFTSNNLTTRFVLRALHDRGLRIPEDVAIAGFDDFELADALRPTLTLVRQPSSELGRIAASLLFERLNGAGFPERGQRVVLPVELIVRSSCGCTGALPARGASALTAAVSQA